ncbi:MAG: SsrA-binding protein SmpB [Candidatus Omnitrophota bacterium]
MKIISNNRKAYHDYAVLETLECGIELRGSEVKSLRAGKINVNDSFARIEEGEALLYNANISPYAEASYLNVEPTRVRKLLLHKKQILKLETETAQRGLTLVPIKIYFNARGLVKIELALCKGKKTYDRRKDIKKREVDREVRRGLKSRRG